MVNGFENYGGRGIQFNFSSFQEFIEHIGRRPLGGFTLERKNNEGHYEIGNVEWATRKKQANNRRTKRLDQFTDAELLAELKSRSIQSTNRP